MMANETNETIYGWRLDFVRPNGVGWYGSPPIAAAGHPLIWHPNHTNPITPNAQCLRYGTHHHPVAGCECGWRLVTDPHELHPQARGRRRGNPRTHPNWSWAGVPLGLNNNGENSRDNIIQRGAIVHVRTHGRTLESSDTATTVCAQRLERLHIHVIESRTGTETATAVRNLYGENQVTVHPNIDECLDTISETKRNY